MAAILREEPPSVHPAEVGRVVRRCLAKDPADLTPLLEEEGLPKGSLWESCAIMQYLCNKHGLDRFYPTDPGERAMVDSAMFYLIGTFYPLLARATYPALGFPQYPGEVATSEADDELKAKAQADATAALAKPLDVYRAWFLDGRTFIGGEHPSIADIRFAATLEDIDGVTRVGVDISERPEITDSSEEATAETADSGTEDDCRTRDHIARFTRERPFRVCNAASITLRDDSLRRPEFLALATGTRRVMRSFSK